MFSYFSGKHFLFLPVVLRIFLNNSLTFKFHDQQIKHITISLFRGVQSFSSDGLTCVVFIFVSCGFCFSIVLDYQCVSNLSCGTIWLTGVDLNKNYNNQVLRKTIRVFKEFEEVTSGMNGLWIGKCAWIAYLTVRKRTVFLVTMTSRFISLLSRNYLLTKRVSSRK